MTSAVELGRDAFERRAWSEVYSLLSSHDDLGPADLERLAVAANLIGRNEESDRASELAYDAYMREGGHDRAAHAAFWLAFSLFFRGEAARAGGWLARAEALIEAAGPTCSVRGFLLLIRYLEAVDSGDHEAAISIASDMVEIAGRTGDRDLRALSVLCLGEATAFQGDTKQGMRHLDEAMLATTSGELSPVLTGIVYCAAIETCMNAYEIRRAGEWTDALHGWCSAQPDLVPFRGQCLVHRSQVLQAHGDWRDAAAEIDRACDRLAEPPHPALGLALYQQGELHRLRGDLDAASSSYRAASEAGRDPHPGLALLRLAQGNPEAATATITRLLKEHEGRVTSLPMLAAAVEVRLATGDVAAARAASDQLTGLAAAGAPLLHAVADYTAGSVAVAAGDAAAALPLLRRAHERWHELGMPYEAARAREQIALACRALGDVDAAALELDTARAAFEKLGAEPDLARVTALAPAGNTARSGTLTERECEVLRLVVTGKSNREIAADLFISEHTVARHLQNMFTKLGISSRAAATAYAYEHGLV